MSFIEFHWMGGALFMIVLSISLTIIIATAILNIIRLSKGKYNPADQILVIKDIKDLGIFAIVWGIFGQSLGLFQALKALEASPDVSPAVVYGGIKVSFITTLYGMFIFLFSWLIFILLRNWNRKIDH
ncbi:MAG: MotA/TolQ/ExbB proton channel family protein [Cytophagales bacterium]|nr:MotA/TolQ/ExbB proton channel family protein [Cytophagales bacterium]